MNKPLFQVISWVGITWGLTSCQWWPLQQQNRELAIIVNHADPLSVQIAQYYRQKRNIPTTHVIEVIFDPSVTSLSPEQFRRIKQEVDGLTPPEVKGYALTWTKPYRVDCMSITSAFALGFDPRHCAKGCKAIAPNPYFNSNRSEPFIDFGIRPTMAITATTFTEAKALIDRGVNSDNTHPQGTAYLMDTKDQARNVRSNFYTTIVQQLSSKIPIEVIKNNVLKDKNDVLFYFTGVTKVRALDSNTFLPGAMADHLTSFGGQLTDSGQMSSLEWLEAGATGSYGTVVEPCNFVQKFPHPGIAMYHYLQGDNLLHAYWKSVAWVGQGIFIGEPLARPFGNDKND
ncbi:TIGR03790 family protein [Crocosphaera sp.]|uniref:TIGR03790 family protein n=1 Tax=Crocosphaera sp. TaxID=2729996 RepID=UPI003F262E81|nr:TIGR03790 family protein [Crocosphaera sp.]